MKTCGFKALASIILAASAFAAHAGSRVTQQSAATLPPESYFPSDTPADLAPVQAPAPAVQSSKSAPAAAVAPTPSTPSTANQSVFPGSSNQPAAPVGPVVPAAPAPAQKQSAPPQQLEQPASVQSVQPANADGCISSFPASSLKPTATAKQQTYWSKAKAILANIEKALGGKLNGAKFALGNDSQYKQMGAIGTFRFSSSKSDRIVLSGHVEAKGYNINLNTRLQAQQLCVSKGTVTADFVGTGDQKGQLIHFKMNKTNTGIALTGQIAGTGLSDEPFVRQ